MVLEKTLESPLDCKEIQSVNPKGNQPWVFINWKGWCWSWSSNTLATWCKDLTDWKRPWCWERLRSGGKGDGRGWDDWMASPTLWTWVWANSGRWWRIVKPGVLQSMGSQRVRHDWATEQWCSHFCGRYRMVIPCLMIITSSLGKTPKTHRWVLSNPPFWPQRTVLLEYQLTQTEPFMVPSFWRDLLKPMWGKSNNPSLVANQRGVRERGKKSLKRMKASEKLREELWTHRSCPRPCLSSQSPRGQDTPLFFRWTPVCATQLKLAFCHLPSITLTAFPFLAGKSFRIYNTFNYRMVFVRILSVTSGRNLAQTG